jgi:diguanylate cyclase (GGDEF)-like protein
MFRGNLEKSFGRLKALWSLTRFDDAGLSNYAQELVLNDTRKGVMVLGLVSVLLLACGAFFYTLLGYEPIYLYSYSILAMLSAHMYFSARAINDIRALYLLGIAILVINGVVLVLTAHQVGTISLSLFASVILLFLVMPLVPWGLREAVVIVVMIYTVFTLSTLTVEGRFEGQTLWVLQFVLLAAGLSTLTVIGRTAIVRKDDLQARYELEQARSKMEILSLVDPMTQSWNRRFLEQRFKEIIDGYKKTNDQFYFAVIDVDNFKLINDTFGHDFGDLVLKRLASIFRSQFNDDHYFIRMGGDEFAVLYAGKGPEAIIRLCGEKLSTDSELVAEENAKAVLVSSGVVIVDDYENADIDQIYRQADKALYQAKNRSAQQKLSVGVVTTRFGE